MRTYFKIKVCFRRGWPSYNLCRRMRTRLSQRNPRLRSGCAFKHRFSTLSLYEQFGVRFEVRFHFIFEHRIRKFFAELYAFLIETVDIP